MSTVHHLIVKLLKNQSMNIMRGSLLSGGRGGGVEIKSKKKKERKKTVRLHDRFLPTYIADIGHHIILK